MQPKLRQVDEPAAGVNVGRPWDAAHAYLEARHSEGGEHRFYCWRGECYVYEGARYRLLSRDDLRADIYRWLGEVAPGAKFGRRAVDDLLDALRAAAKLDDRIIAPAWLTPPLTPLPSELIVCANGLLHYPTRTFHAPSPLLFAVNALDVAYDPDAGEPIRWLEFLASVWGDDPESIDVLQELFGYLLTLDTRQQKIFLIVGPRRSGKGTIARALMRLLGAANTCAPTLANLGAQFGLATLVGKHLALISDARLGGRADAAAIAENLLRISGEDPVSVPRKFLDDYTAALPVRFLLLTNEVPRLADASGALPSRFVVLRLTRSFLGREDKALADRLYRELPALLLWALEGLERLRARGAFRQPESALDHLAELERLASPMMTFVEERLVLDPTAKTPVREVFAEWKTWCHAQGREAIGDVQRFGQMLHAACPAIATRQVRVDGEPARVYEGLRLRMQGAA